ncbi:MAG: hypothetical protein SFX73_11005 [Kofleriaceae bacterium]|nr:hypothetical protein [Kofleriaceae bacterium]
MKVHLLAAAALLVTTTVHAGSKTALSGAPAPSPPPAPEPSRRMVAVLDVRVEGVSEDVARQFEKDLEDQLDTKAYWLANTAQVRERLRFSTRWTEGCIVGTCLSELRTQTSAELVLLAALKGEGTSYGYVVTLVRTDNGRVLSQESGRCDVCTAREAMREATLATINLLNAVPEKLPDEVAERGAEIDMAVGKLVRRINADERRQKRWGLGMLATGLTIAAAGVAAYVVTDKAETLAAVGAGGGLAVGGVFVLSF